MGSAALKYVPQTAATTFAFSPVFILLPWAQCMYTYVRDMFGFVEFLISSARGAVCLLSIAFHALSRNY